MTDKQIARSRAGSNDPDEGAAEETNHSGSREPLAPAKVPVAPPRPARTSNDRLPGSPIHADKPVFTLSVAADLLGMHPRTLRIYEEERLVVPYRTDTQRRRYSQNDIKRFQFIQHLTQGLHVNLAGVRIILEMLEELSKMGVDYTPRLYEMAEEQISTRDLDEP